MRGHDTAVDRRPPLPVPGEPYGAALPHLLTRATRADVRTEPFPHLVLRDAVEPALYRRLEATFPPLEQIAGGAAGSNRRVDRKAGELLGDPAIAPVWRELTAAHLAPRFFGRFADLFYPHLLALHGDLLGRAGTVPRIGVRYLDSHPSCDILLDFMIAANTPVSGESSSVRGAHVDLPNKLFTALFYMRDENDDSTGGDLELYRLRADAPRRYRERQPADTRAESQVPDRWVECVATVPYAANTLVVFVNGPHAFHGVSPRSVTPYPRRFACAVAQVEGDRFELNDLQGAPS